MIGLSLSEWKMIVYVGNFGGLILKAPSAHYASQNVMGLREAVEEPAIMKIRT
jgi:hypothetical protein